jgi:hypothetical protein
MEETVRTERGPLLRTFERPRVVEGGVRGTVAVTWPTLTLTLEGFDTCRTERVEEYAEEKIHEHRGSGAGAALSTGIVGVGGGAILLAFTPLFSANPNTNSIDAAGHYGAPPRDIATGWGVALMCIGAPALAVAIVQFIRTGEETETSKVEQLAGQHDEVCHARPVDGPVVIANERGEREPPLAASGGALTVDAARLKGPIDSFVFYEREVPLDETSQRLLGAFNSCLTVEHQGAAEPEALSTAALLKRVEALRECHTLRGDAVAPEQAKLEAEVARRREGGDTTAFPSSARGPRSWEDALAANPPKWTLEPGSADLKKLDDTAHLGGTNVLVRGTVSGGLSPNIGVVTVGPRPLFIFLPPDAPWASDDFGINTPVELVGVLSGLQTVGDQTAPLVKALWMRKLSSPRQ